MSSCLKIPFQFAYINDIDDFSSKKYGSYMEMEIRDLDFESRNFAST